MILSYSVNGNLVKTERSDENVIITSSRDGSRRVTEVLAVQDLVLEAAEDSIGFVFNKADKFFVNGYQSWTDSFEYSWSDKLKNVKKLPKKLVEAYAFDKYGDGFFYNYQKNVFHGFDLAYVRGTNSLFVANNNFRTAYLIIEFHKNEKSVVLKSDVKGLKVSKGQSVTVFDYVITEEIEKGKREYFDQFPAPKAEKLFGYTSWYNHYQDINEDIIMGALNNSTEHFELFQIDDGFEEYVGDWLKIDSKKFPNGLKPIVDKAHEKGMKAGVWLAPFAAEEKSALFHQYPDWFCKDKAGAPIKCGSNWSGFYALDIGNPEAVAYIKQTLSFYKDLGFDFFKLDFLYAASVMEQPGFTRAQVAQKAYELLRTELEGKLILGCGAVFSNCFGLFDYLRVGPDVSLIFDDVWYMRRMHRERISTKVTLRNTIYRHMFDHKVFLNDPDVFLLRSHNIKLNRAQREALTTINSLFGSLLMTSDNPKHYASEEDSYLKKCMHLFHNAEVLSVETVKNKIVIIYKVDGQVRSFNYFIKKGIIK